MTRKEIEEFKAKSHEERVAELLDTMSDVIKYEADHLMMMKAIAKHTHNIDPEDFDATLNKEMQKAWKKYEDKSEEQITAMVLLDLLSRQMKCLEENNGKEDS